MPRLIQLNFFKRNFCLNTTVPIVFGNSNVPLNNITCYIPIAVIIFSSKGRIGDPVRCIPGSGGRDRLVIVRSEKHRSEHQSLMRIWYAVLCVKKKNTDNTNHNTEYTPKVPRPQ